jgi:hypothetical protein
MPKVIVAVSRATYAIVDAADETNDEAIGASKIYKGRAAAEKALAKLEGRPAPPPMPRQPTYNLNKLNREFGRSLI